MGKRRKRIAAVIALAVVCAGLALVPIRSRIQDVVAVQAADPRSNPPNDAEESPGKNHVPIDGKIAAGDARLSFHGALEFLKGLKGLDLDFVFKGSDPEELGRALGIALKNTPSYRIEGHLRREKYWSLGGVSAVIGDSNFQGTASVDLSGDRPLVRANVSSSKAYWSDVNSLFLDLKEEKQRPKAARRNYLSVDRLDPTLMRKLNADVSFRGDWVRTPQAVLTNVNAHVELKGGVLTYDARGFVASGGKLVSHGRVDVRGKTVTSSFGATINRVDIQKVLRRFNIPNFNPGTVGGRFDVSGKGRSMAEFFNTLSGDMAVILAGGSFETIRVDVLERDFFELLTALGAGEAGGRIHCAVGDFHARSGVVTVNVLVIEIPDAIITGAGTIDFRNENLDLTLTPHPKDPGLWNLAGIAHVTGSFRDPQVSVDMLEDIGSATEAVDAGALVQPLAGLLRYIDPADPGASGCRRLLNAAGKRNDRSG